MVMMGDARCKDVVFVRNLGGVRASRPIKARKLCGGGGGCGARCIFGSRVLGRGRRDF